MDTRVWRTLAKIVGVILIVAGAGVAYGGTFANSFIAQQLGEQNITMPTAEAIDAQVASGRISAEDAAALRPYAGEVMSTGNQAQAFADHYIAAHMRAAAVDAGVPDATFATLGNVFNDKRTALIEELSATNADADEELLGRMADAQIANPLTEYDLARDAAAIKELRYDIFLDGNTLRGMLLNAYGWGMIGTIALWAGGALIVVGLGLAVYSFAPTKKKA